MGEREICLTQITSAVEAIFCVRLFYFVSFCFDNDEFGGKKHFFGLFRIGSVSPLYLFLLLPAVAYRFSGSFSFLGACTCVHFGTVVRFFVREGRVSWRVAKSTSQFLLSVCKIGRNGGWWVDFSCGLILCKGCVCPILCVHTCSKPRFLLPNVRCLFGFIR